MESGFCSSRTDRFPAGLRVLVVDDDPTWLKILEKMLKKCSYEVTTCFLARDALNLLRERKDYFDLVISDVNMPDMDGFKLLEHVGLEMDLPVIMMSVDGETSRVMKGVQHGACDYLLKPIRMKELSNIWQHVLRKKIHESKDYDYHECMGKFQVMRNMSDGLHDGHVATGDSSGAMKKRKDVESKKLDDKESVEASSSKKARVVWCVDLHQKFVSAVNQIGIDKVGPKKILDLMKVPGLTRENVASHLQKYRLYLSRLENQNEQEVPSGGIKQQDFPPTDPPRKSFGYQNMFTVDGDSAENGDAGHTTNKIPIDNMGKFFRESDLKGMISFSPVRKLKSPLIRDLSDSQKASISPRMDHTHFPKLLDQNSKYPPLDSTLPTQQWNDNPMMQFKQPPNQETQPYSLEAAFTVSSGMHNHVVDQQCTDNWNRLQQKMTSGEPNLAFSLEENVQLLVQGYGCCENIEYQCSYYNPESIAELQPDYHHELGFYPDKLHDSLESPFLDQGLFTA